MPNLWQVPLGTLASNVLGSLVLGALLGFVGPRERGTTLTPWTAGLLGAATTFSTFILEVVALWPQAPATAAGYLVTSIAAGLLAARLGRLAGTHRAEQAGHAWSVR